MAICHFPPCFNAVCCKICTATEQLFFTSEVHWLCLLGYIVSSNLTGLSQNIIFVLLISSAHFSTNCLEMLLHLRRFVHCRCFRLCHHAFISITHKKHSPVAMTVFVACHFFRPDQMTKNKGSLSPMRGPLKLLYIELPRWPPLLPFTGGVAHGVSAVLTGIQAERSEGLCAHCRSLGGHAVPHTDCHRERMLPQDCQGTQSRLPLPLACQNCKLPFVVAFQTCL